MYFKYSVTVLSFQWGIYIGRKPESQLMLLRRQFSNNKISYRLFAVLDEVLCSFFKHFPAEQLTLNETGLLNNGDTQRALMPSVSCSHWRSQKLKIRICFSKRYATNWTSYKLSIMKTSMSTSHINEQNRKLNLAAYCSLLPTAEIKLLEDFKHRLTGRWDYSFVNFTVL